MGAEALTYQERKGLGYGTVQERLGKVTSPLHHQHQHSPDYQPSDYLDSTRSQGQMQKKEITLGVQHPIHCKFQSHTFSMAL